jgi:hypothetical protein
VVWQRTAQEPLNRTGIELASARVLIEGTLLEIQLRLSVDSRCDLNSILKRDEAVCGVTDSNAQILVSV